MYGNTLYGLAKYAREAEDSHTPKEYFVDLARYVLPFLAELRELAELYRAEGYEIGYLQHNLRDLFDQCFIATATWGLVLWESMYGAVTNLSLSYEQRREILLAKLRGQSTTTKQMIEDTAAAFSGGEVQVIEDNPHHHFVIRFVGIKGIPRNMQAFIDMLNDIKPAHLSYSFEYTYTVWGNLKDFTWGALRAKTWAEVKVMEGV